MGGKSKKSPKKEDVPMRIFIQYKNERQNLDIYDGKTVLEIKQIIRDKFDIGTQSDNKEKKVLVLHFAGADLKDEWIFKDAGIHQGETIHVLMRNEVHPTLYIHCAFSQETIPILQPIDCIKMQVEELRTIAAEKSGIPVTVFRLTNAKGVEMYDCQTLFDYGVEQAHTINLETWDGWNDFLNVAIMGFTAQVMTLISENDVVGRFQMKVALHIAAHFGHVDLAVSLLRQGLRASEPIGEHPIRQWCNNDAHTGSYKCPIHVAVENGQLGVLRTFINHDICNMMVKNIDDLMPLNIALRKKKKSCASFLLTKQWTRMHIGKSTVSLAIYARIKKWAEKAKANTFFIYGQSKSSLKRPPYVTDALLGNGVHLDGFSTSPMMAKAKADKQDDSKKRPAYYYFQEVGYMNPEEYFRRILSNAKQAKTQTFTKALFGGRQQLKNDLPSSRSVTPEKRQRPRSKSIGASRLRLPPINEGPKVSVSNPDIQNASKSATGRNSIVEQTLTRRESIAADNVSRIESTTGFIQTGLAPVPPKDSKDIEPDQLKSRKKSISKKKKKRGGASAVQSLMAKNKASELSIPLPQKSVETTPRPYFHSTTQGENLADSTLELFETYRGETSRDYAIKCLSVANKYKERPWLSQVRTAMEITARGVRKAVLRQPHLFAPFQRTSTVGTIGTRM